MRIVDKDYQVVFDPATNTVTFAGVLSLRGATEYRPMVELLDKVAALHLEKVTLDLQDLQFLNSFGINILFRFVITLRERGGSALRVRGSRKVAWQPRSLQTLFRLMPEMQLDLSS